MKLEDGDNVRPLRWTKVFTGAVGGEKQGPACLTITEHEGQVEALLTIAAP